MRLLLLLALSNAYGQTLTPENTLSYFGQMSVYSNVNFFMGYHEMRTSNKNDLYVVIHSGGGQYEAALQTIDILSADKHAHAIIIFAASGAAAISQNMGGNTYIVPKGQLMFHEVKVMTDNAISKDDATEIAQGLTEANDKFGPLCNARMHLADYAKRVKQDWWLTAAEAIKLKAAQRGKFKCSPALYSQQIEVPVFDYISGQRTLINFCNLL